MISEFKKKLDRSNCFCHSVLTHICTPSRLVRYVEATVTPFHKAKKTTIIRIMFLPGKCPDLAHFLQFLVTHNIILLKVIQNIDYYSCSINHMHTVASGCFYVPPDNALLVFNRKCSNFNIKCRYKLEEKLHIWTFMKQKNHIRCFTFMYFVNRSDPQFHVSSRHVAADIT